jgi:L-ascorbate metabolism protein UlaG (beta-lactamase superfamily)
MSTTTITYIGGPTALIEFAGLTIVTDPTFDEPQSYSEPGSSTLVKTHGPAIARTDLPPIDLVLLSHHSHKDNLDYEGLELLATGVRTLSTADAATELFGGGLTGLDDWESTTVGPVTVTAVPALHGPPGSERFVGHVTGFVLEAPGERTIYVSGDNASLPLVKQIAGRFPQIDIALLFAGAARVARMEGALTLTSTDAVEAAKILAASSVVGLHTEHWEHFRESRADLERAFEGTDLLVDTPPGTPIGL